MESILLHWFRNQSKEAFFSLDGGIKEVEQGDPTANLRITYQDVNLGRVKNSYISRSLSKFSPIEVYKHLLLMRVVVKGKITEIGFTTALFYNCYKTEGMDHVTAKRVALEMGSHLKNFIVFPGAKEMKKGWYYPMLRIITNEEIQRFTIGIKAMMNDVKKTVMEATETNPRVESAVKE